MTEGIFIPWRAIQLIILLAVNTACWIVATFAVEMDDDGPALLFISVGTFASVCLFQMGMGE